MSKEGGIAEQLKNIIEKDAIDQIKLIKDKITSTQEGEKKQANSEKMKRQVGTVLLHDIHHKSELN